MINKDDLVALTWEQKVKYRAAIKHGYFDDFVDDPRKWKHTFLGAFIWKYPDRCRVIMILDDILGHMPTWEDMTDDVLRDLVEELQSCVAASSARTMCAEVKALLNANRKKIPSEDFKDILSLRNEVSQAIYLTRDEIKKIIDYKPISDNERFVRRNFLIEFMTGARRCDAECLTISNCDVETGTLSYVPQKTPGIVVTVPVDERLGLRPLLAETMKKDMCRDSFNDTIRSICHKCGIDTVCTIQRRGMKVTEPKWKLVTSHTARRSFATNMYLAGVSLEDIAVLMGHGKNIETTKRYICAERQLSNSVISYFRPPMEEVMCYKEEEEEEDDGRSVYFDEYDGEPIDNSVYFEDVEVEPIKQTI